MVTRKKQFMIALIAAFVMVDLIAVFYWFEAKKEVVVLCGNFGKGVTQSSVLEQLDTGHFLKYRLEKFATGSRIEVDGKLSFGAYQCVIEFDPEDKVVVAEAR